MKFPRSSGILLHPTSFPGRYGIGELNKHAYQFIDFLAEAKQQIWQVLPLGPTGYGDSPYQSFSAFAGNPLLIDLNDLASLGLIPVADLEQAPDFPQDTVDYGWVIHYKYPMLRQAFETFSSQPNHLLREEFDRFRDEEAWWLNDYAIFMSLKDRYEGKNWTQWDKGLVKREDSALHEWGEKLAHAIDARKFWQFLFFRQWSAIKKYANDRGIQIVGDIPIYVAHDSSDVWANPEVFYLDDDGNPTVVAGVPPDYFSETGQLWGNPIYRWDLLKDNGYHWWVSRFRQVFKLVDIVRLDHFRGFEAYWEVPASEETAMNGQWVQGPGASIFETLERELGELPIMAENLGVITEEVEALRKRFHFPGMAILQFAFGSDAHSIDLPHSYEANQVAYTGTHDNDTTMGWWLGGTEGTTRTEAEVKKEKDFAKKYLNTGGDEMNWTFIRTLMASVADTVVFPVQDLLGVGTEARMNLPGRPAGNWQWRYREGQLENGIAERLRDLVDTYGREKKVEEEE